MACSHRRQLAVIKEKEPVAENFPLDIDSFIDDTVKQENEEHEENLDNEEESIENSPAEPPSVS